ncbi:hypothetical protein FHS21_001324 [Phyllobacterium trifolii]|uniref:Uncharacterized protein n=1 Tax=Phyllobacterium trifolii TaxID=300193 RepID=A0A839U4Q6_9HYPH|nr:hypothetical protein [Phyllobacterium trifolii]
MIAGSTFVGIASAGTLVRYSSQPRPPKDLRLDDGTTRRDTLAPVLAPPSPAHRRQVGWIPRVRRDLLTAVSKRGMWADALMNGGLSVRWACFTKPYGLVATTTEGYSNVEENHGSNNDNDQSGTLPLRHRRHFESTALTQERREQSRRFRFLSRLPISPGQMTSPLRPRFPAIRHE